MIDRASRGSCEPAAAPEPRRSAAWPHGRTGGAIWTQDRETR